MSSITVVIPTYNRSVELKRALQSLVYQRDKNFSVIVCDDGSTENIGAVTKKFENKLKIDTIFGPRSGGPARPRNSGIQAAKTEWISLLDSDDWWNPDKVEKIRSRLLATSDFVYHKMAVEMPKKRGWRISNSQCTIGKQISNADPELDLIKNGNAIPTSSATFRRQMVLEIGGFDERTQLTSVEDLDAWIKISKKGCNFIFIDQVLGNYSRASDSISKFSEKQYECHKFLFDRHLREMDASRHEIAEVGANYLLGSYALMLQKKEAISHFNKIRFQKDPKKWIKSRLKLILKRTSSLR